MTTVVGRLSREIVDFPTKGSRLKGSRLSTQHQLARKSAVWDNNDLMEILSEKFEAMSASMEMMKREKELLERENRRLRASRDAPPGDNDVNTGSTPPLTPTSGGYKHNSSNNSSSNNTPRLGILHEDRDTRTHNKPLADGNEPHSTTSENNSSRVATASNTTTTIPN